MEGPISNAGNTLWYVDFFQIVTVREGLVSNAGNTLRYVDFFQIGTFREALCEGTCTNASNPRRNYKFFIFFSLRITDNHL